MILFFPNAMDDTFTAGAAYLENPEILMRFSSKSSEKGCKRAAYRTERGSAGCLLLELLLGSGATALGSVTVQFSP
jgi:hypothetical protein